MTSNYNKFSTNQAGIQTTLAFGPQIVEGTLGFGLSIPCFWLSEFLHKRAGTETLGQLSSLLKRIIPLLPQFLVHSRSSSSQVETGARAQLCEQIKSDLAKFRIGILSYAMENIPR